MEKGNVLVIGNSGVGKSTLINAVLGEEKTMAKWGGSMGTTNHLEIYGNEGVPFQLIDTVGFEPSFFRAKKAINLVKKWSKESVKESGKEKQINIIWFCVDGTSARLFHKTIENLSKATAMWESVPIIAVITKSYSVPDREPNKEMVSNAFAKSKHSKNLKKIIPVVAATFVLNESAFAPSEGIDELIRATNELMPEGIRAGAQDISNYVLSRKRALAHGTVTAATVAAVVTGAVPVPFADAAILTPLEIGEINAIARVYGIHKDEKSNTFINSIVEVGTVSGVAKTVISALKAIPGINIATSLLNAIIAGSIVAAIGEGSIYAFEKVYLGEKSIEDVDWVKRMLESKFAESFITKIQEVIEKAANSGDSKDIGRIIVKAVSDLFSSQTKKIE
ncbi:MAG: GTP-binding DUF697 domain-containing protein [Muribaculum sp.]|nr:GTP-binding DUF697 domain-containing protein [Muribaculum sp.]